MDSYMKINSEYLNTLEAAAHLRCSRQFLEIARHRGEGPAYCKLGRAVRYRKSALDEWMTAHEHLHPERERVSDSNAPLTHSRLGARG